MKDSPLQILYVPCTMLCRIIRRAPGFSAKGIKTAATKPPRSGAPSTDPYYEIWSTSERSKATKADEGSVHQPTQFAFQLE